MSVGIDFVLKANTAAFTKGLAVVDNATSKLQKSLLNKFEGRDLARGLTTALGLSIDKIADKFARLWTGMSEEAEKAFAELDKLTDTLTEKTIEAGTARLSSEQKYQLAITQTEQLQRKIAENQGKTVEQQVQLTKDKIALLDKEKEAASALAAVEKEADEKRADREKERKMIEDARIKGNEEVQKQGKEEAQKAAESDEKRAQDIREKFAPSVEQLAQMDVGTGVSGNDPRLIARQILQKEGFAAAAGNRGDIAGAIKLGGEATAMREGISNIAGGGTALTAETAETALRNALDTTNKELVDVKTALAGIIKAQK